MPECVKHVLNESLDKLFDFALRSDAPTELRGAVGESLAGIVASGVSKASVMQLCELIDTFFWNRMTKIWAFLHQQ